MRDAEPEAASKQAEGISKTTKVATLHDVARKVGVSPRTVSRVVNDEGGYSQATRERILEAIEELRYRPNLLARGLISGRSGTVGLVGRDMSDHFFAATANGIQQTAREAGRTMFFASTGGDADRQGEVLNSLWSHAVDGVVVFPVAGSNDQLADYGRRGLPVVVVDDSVDAPNIACVGFDFEAAARLGVQHLLDTGRRRIAMVASTLSPPTGRDRERGFHASVAQADDARGELVRAQPTVAGGEAALGQLLELQPDLDGIFAHNDLAAIGAMRAARAHARRVPEDLAVVGVGDIDISALVTPALTTIGLDPARLVRAATRALHQLIDTPGHRPDPAVLPVELVVRQST